MAKSAVKKEKSEQIVSTKKLTKVKKDKKEKEVLKSKPVKEEIEKVLKKKDKEALKPKTPKPVKDKNEKALKKKKLKKQIEIETQSLGLPAAADGAVVDDLKISPAVLEKAITALKTGFEKTTASNAKENLFSTEVRYGMQVVYVKIPKIPAHNRKM